MANLQGFDANQVEPNAGFDPLPSGKYLAVIVESEIKPTKNGDGSYLQLKFEVLDGPYAKRLVWARLNLDNPNQTAVKIARAELSAICRAVGVMTPNDSTDLHNLPLVVNVKCRKRKDSEEVENYAAGYGKRESPAAAPQAATSTAPWRR